MHANLHPRSRVDEFRRLGYWTDETIDGLFRARVSERGDALAIVDPANRRDLVGSEPRRLSWRELGAEVTHLAARLLDNGVRRGDVIGVQLPNTIELIQVYLAAWTIGAVVSPLAMQYREHEIITMAGTARFDIMITSWRFMDRGPAQSVAAVADQLPGVRRLIAFGDPQEAPDRADRPESIVHVSPAAAGSTDIARVSEHRRTHPNDPNDCVTICWTSGTESLPKGVMRAHYDWLAFSWATVDAPRLTADDVLLNPFPMINMAGINGMLLPWLRTGAALVQHHPFDAKTFFAQIGGEGVTYTLAPPALMWTLLNNEDMLSKIDLSRLTRVGSGSAPLQPAMVRGWQERLGIGVINFFGSNEGVGLLSSLEDFPDPETRARFFPRYGTPGVKWSSRASEWTELKLVDPLSGEVIDEPGLPGELCIRGPQLFARYVRGEELPDPFDEEGYLKTGDIFEIAGDGNQYLRYVDRAKDLIIRGGMNIAPAELEAMIVEHPAVLETAVIGDPDVVLGERVAAVVVLQPGASLTLGELVAFLRSYKIASYKLPERLHQVESLPHNPVGKVLKRDLRRRPEPASS